MLVALVVSAAVSGCAGGHSAGLLFYLVPYRLDDLDCTQLSEQAAAAGARLREAEQLRAAAAADPAGAIVNALVYGPDYEKARWEHRLYLERAQRRNCHEPPAAGPARAMDTVSPPRP